MVQSNNASLHVFIALGKTRILQEFVPIFVVTMLNHLEVAVFIIGVDR